MQKIKDADFIPSRPLRSYAAVFAVSAVATVLLTAAAFGSRGDDWLRWVAGLEWRLHAPELSLLAAAPLAVRIHVAGVVTALLIGFVLMIRVKGTAIHKALGWVWVVAMVGAAVASLFIHDLNPDGFSFLHLFSGWTLIAAPMAIAAIRRGKVRLHARTMTGLFLGGLLFAGLFSFLPGRLMWEMFFG